MRQLLILYFLVFVWFNATAQDKGFEYNYNINLNKVDNDKIKVTLQFPATDETTLIYQFPSIIPGTYKVYDFGRFITKLKVYDANNNSIPTERLDVNRWSINNQTLKATKITYWVSDTWDSMLPTRVFEPAGTNIQKDKVFILNNHGFFGYFEGKMEAHFTVKVSKPSTMYGATSLKPIKTSSLTDTYAVDNYHRLVDNPIMYSEADTASVQIGSTNVFIGLYSPNKKLDAKTTAKSLKEVLKAQEKFLKGKLPTDRYTFLIYLSDKPSNSGANGALEHWNSSFYFLPEMNAKSILPIIQEIASHEFFHIITPLSIHSDEIAEFDFMQPKMSQHLWLYEGVTEYFAGLALVQEHVISENAYLEALHQKIITSTTLYDRNLPFTELSKECLEKYSVEYSNVYQKGALIAFGLDLVLLENSNGKYGLRDLMLDLSERYGANVSFQDDQLFDIIDDISNIPEAKEYLIKYVTTSTPLPLTQMFHKVGILYQEEKISKTTTFGNVGLSMNDKDQIIIDDITELDEFGKKIGYQKGDVLLEFNKIEVSADNIGTIINDFVNHPESFPKVKILIERKGKIIKLKSKTQVNELIEENVFEKEDDCSEQQQKLFNVWLNKSSQ
ncbi:M61 family metallopeptidase [Flammeovirga kamogawensis]|uniref:Peptidase M61 n=1 Tax=Flammeovirga kamogawensis TaxID=373891 RepID=A0ABX8GWL6_9BACT|nr:peptidase M61 [Flammeovirga kamogawensis]MBB6461239.1 putative metalloprotease with PDZ domain [Flammeovirga kamogawensis]QWG07799.1 peptidase M61 [Flammeovirga kamogawensis]